MTFVEFLKWGMSITGVTQIVAFIIGLGESLAVEWIPGFTEFHPKSKRLATMIASLLLPLVFLVGLCALGQAEFSYEAVWAALTAGFCSFFGTQAMHMREL